MMMMKKTLLPSTTTTTPPAADGAPAGDAEPDEGAADGHADRLVQGVPQVLRHLLHAGLAGTRCRVSPGWLELWASGQRLSQATQFFFLLSYLPVLLQCHQKSEAGPGGSDRPAQLHLGLPAGQRLRDSAPADER